MCNAHCKAYLLIQNLPHRKGSVSVIVYIRVTIFPWHLRFQSNISIHYYSTMNRLNKAQAKSKVLNSCSFSSIWPFRLQDQQGRIKLYYKLLFFFPQSPRVFEEERKEENQLMLLRKEFCYLHGSVHKLLLDIRPGYFSFQKRLDLVIFPWERGGGGN